MRGASCWKCSWVSSLDSAIFSRPFERESGMPWDTAVRYYPQRNQNRKACPPALLKNPSKVSTGPKSAARAYRELIQAAEAQGLSSQKIWQRPQVAPRLWSRLRFGTGRRNKCASLCGEGLVLGLGSPLPHKGSYESLVDLPNPGRIVKNSRQELR